MKYKLVPRKNPQKLDDPPKLFAQPVYDGTVETNFIARQIAGRSSLTAGDIMNTLSNFFEEIPTYMLLGQTVKLDGLGTFRISFTSNGADSEDTFKVGSMKKRVSCSLPPLRSANALSTRSDTAFRIKTITNRVVVAAIAAKTTARSSNNRLLIRLFPLSFGKAWVGGIKK